MIIATSPPLVCSYLALCRRHARYWSAKLSTPEPMKQVLIKAPPQVLIEAPPVDFQWPPTRPSAPEEREAFGDGVMGECPPVLAAPTAHTAGGELILGAFEAGGRQADP
ncbi:hypothetical protein ACQEVZ_22560 [Dactylosporangium sp. CA-152071]|uniref:hypothetical protein n=1 Tax=Dactylosporangium sp. CA-152071 TaxID=3239933 RepID=UPI003D94CEFB